MKENSYGIKRRIEFIYLSIKSHFSVVINKDIKILEVGCGTGEYISRQLAKKGFLVKGIDLDYNSIEYAKKRNKFPNLKYQVKDLKEIDEKYDVIICSEVLEHLKDPLEMLTQINQKLSARGIVIVTIPNGYGPFEFFSLIYHLSLKRERKPNGNNQKIPDSLNSNCPHIQHFTISEIKTLFKKANFIAKFQKNRSFLCGPYIRFILNKVPFINKINLILADHLPARAVSGWMFVLIKLK